MLARHHDGETLGIDGKQGSYATEKVNSLQRQYTRTQDTENTINCLFSGNCVSRQQNGKPFWILMKL